MTDIYKIPIKKTTLHSIIWSKSSYEFENGIKIKIEGTGKTDKSINLYVEVDSATARAEGAERIGKKAVLDYIMSLGWQDTDSEYVKEVIADADKLAEELQALLKGEAE